MGKTPLILVPGLLLTEDLWTDILPCLVERADIWITEEQRLYDNLPAIAEAILAKAPPTFALAGLSMGGYVAFEMLRQAPERVERLALLNTSARTDTNSRRLVRQSFIALAQQKGQFRGVTPTLLPQLLHPSRLNDKDLTDRIFAMAGAVGRDGFIRQQTAILARPDSRSFLPSIQCRTLIIAGEADRLTPPDHALEMAALIPNVKLHILSDCGHLTPMEAPNEVAHLMVQWLGGASS